MSKKQPRPDNDEQSKRFLEAAKQAQADESGEEFERASRVLLRGNKKPADSK
jgi:hypothetical protein